MDFPPILTDESAIRPISLGDLQKALPPAHDDPALTEDLRRRIRESQVKVVAVDDDPTGCQTVHDVPLLLEWTVEELAEGLGDTA
ncbi:MAG: hypothetical protein ACUVT1_08360, partial [Anaerolineae bacterium]